MGRSDEASIWGIDSGEEDCVGFYRSKLEDAEDECLDGLLNK